MPETFIPGYLGVITVDSNDISAVAHVTALNMSRSVLTKPVFGAPWGNAIGGQKTATFSADGSVSAESHDAVLGLFTDDGPLAATLQVGEAAGATDAGLYSGSVVISQFNISANADGQWEFSIAGTFNGTVSHTPAGP